VERYVPFPFPGERFPDDLGAVIQRTVLDGQHPARYVGHTAENDWVVGDGVDDPNADGACVAAHIRHVVDQDASLEALATLPIGFEARRDSERDPWAIEPFTYLDDEQPSVVTDE
jgi:hypothetical protein